MPNLAWGLPGARWSAPLEGLESFVETPPIELLRRGAVIDPGATAIAGQAGALDHATLLRQSQQVAAALAARVPPGAAIACLLPHRPDAIAGLLGCVISGRVALVLNPLDPPERLHALLAEAAPAAILAATTPDQPCAAPVLLLPELLSGPAEDWRLDHAWNPEAPLTVHFTSGSTGRPKGIVLNARGLLARVLEVMQHWQLGPSDRVMVTSLPATSSGMAFLLATLFSGARAVLTQLGLEGARAALRLAAREGVTCAAAGPTLWRLLLQREEARASFASLRLQRSGNSPVLAEDVAAWREVLPPGCVLQHTFASTEAQVIAQWRLPQEALPHGPIPAGNAEPIHEMALLDPDGEPVPPGEAGELTLRGPYLALGEWQVGRLVPGRMLAEPGRPGWRRFHTGDLARVRPDGLLQMLGRSDRQVKINGVRVDPSEIEAILRAESGVTEAAVLALATATRVTLHGFVAAPGRDAAALLPALRRRLADALPSPFRPSTLEVLPDLPRLPANGKLDLVALRRMAGG